MRQLRREFEKQWTEIADRILPRKSDFKIYGRQHTEKGERRTEKVFDAAPALALDRYSAAVHSLVTPRNQMWQKLKPRDPALQENNEVMKYMEEVGRILFAARYSSNFDNQVNECYYDHGAFGNMGMYIGDRLGRQLYYRTVPIDQLYFAENEFGVVDLVHREFKMTARQAVGMFKDKTPMVIKTTYERTPEAEFWFLHCVKPRGDADWSKADYRGMAFVSYYINIESREVCSESGFRVFPYAVGRDRVTSGEIYGRGKADLILPDVKMLNEMNRTTIQAAQLAVLPPLLAHRDGILDAIRLTPAAINYGGVDDNGRQMIQPMNFGGQANIGLELMDQKRAIINDAFWNTLFQILVETPQMTATEAMLRAQERGALLAPSASRIESEFLNPMAEREIDILAAAGLLPDMPEVLRESGGEFAIEYVSPMAQAMRAGEGVAILRTFEQITPLAQVVGPGIFKRYNLDEAARIIAEVNGFPASAMRTDEEVEDLDAAEQEQAQAAQLLQAAPVAASAARDLAQAQTLAASAPNQQAPDLGL